MRNTLLSLLTTCLLAVPITVGGTLSLALDEAPVATAPTDTPKPHKSAAARHSPEQHTARMKQYLDLSDEQTAKVLDSNQRFDASIRKMRAQHKAQMDALTDERNKELRIVLNDEQYQKYLDHQKRRAARMRKHQPPPPGE